MICPICATEAEDTGSCEVCNWEFIYLMDEPTQAQFDDYNNKVNIYKSELYFSLGMIEYNEGQYSNAIEWFLLLIEINPYADVYSLIGGSYLLLQQHEEGIRYLKKSIEINPNDITARLLLEEVERNLKVDNQDETYAPKDLKPEIHEKNIYETMLEEAERDSAITELIYSTAGGIDASYQPKDLKPEMLEKDKFETTDMYNQRMKDLGCLTIGYVKLLDYDADLELLSFTCQISHMSSGIKFKQNIEKKQFDISVSADKAKKLFETRQRNFIANVSYIDNMIEFNELKFEGYCFSGSTPRVPTERYTNMKTILFTCSLDRGENDKYMGGVPSEFMYLEKVFTCTHGEIEALVNQANRDYYGGYNNWVIPSGALMNKFCLKIHMKPEYDKCSFWYSDSYDYKAKCVSFIYINGAQRSIDTRSERSNRDRVNCTLQLFRRITKSESSEINDKQKKIDTIPVKSSFMKKAFGFLDEVSIDGIRNK